MFGRILFPASKLATWRDRTRILQHRAFSDDAVYRALPFFAEIKDALLRHLHEQVQQQYQPDGYVISSSVRKADVELRDFVLDPQGYTELTGGLFKYKSRLVPCTISVQTPEGKKRQLRINERQVVFWSEEYRKKARYERAEAMRNWTSSTCTEASGASKQPSRSPKAS